MPQPRSVAMCSRRFSSMLAMTRSGFRARILPRSGSFSPPMRVLVFTTSRGSTQYTVTPTSASARPSRHRVSVVEGMSDTIRCGGAGRLSATPEASTCAAVTPVGGCADGRPGPAPRASAARARRPTPWSRGTARGRPAPLPDSSPRRPRPRALVASRRSSPSYLQRWRVDPPRIARRLEVLGVDEVHPVVEVHLELAAAVALADPSHRIVQERLHRLTGQTHQPLEADGAGEGLLHSERNRHARPHTTEFFEDLLAAGAFDAAIDEVTREVRLDQVPAPLGDHVVAECTMRP